MTGRQALDVMVGSTGEHGTVGETTGAAVPMTPREAALHEALLDATANLAAARSAYGKYVGRHDRRGARDPLFETRYRDMGRAEERARAALLAHGSGAPASSRGRALTPGQQTSRLAILREVRARGGETDWDALHGRGHDYMQIKAAVRRGDLMEGERRAYALTEAGARALDDAG